MSRPGVFLDRDGTLLDEPGYLGDPAGVKLLPGAAAAVRSLNEAALPVVLITNQSGVARGLFTERDVAAVHQRLSELLAREGAHLDLVLACPHHPSIGEAPYRRTCDCRKPEPGLYNQAIAALALDPARSWAVGDSGRDLEAARRAGVRGLLLVTTGKGAEEDARLRAEGRRDHLLVEDVADASRLVLEAQPR